MGEGHFHIHLLSKIPCVHLIPANVLEFVEYQHFVVSLFSYNYGHF